MTAPDPGGAPFDLRALVRLMADSGLIGPTVIAEKVAENIPEEHLRAALDVTLPHYVHLYLTRERRVTAHPAGGASAKVGAIREGWRRTLAGQYNLGGGVWKVLADCTVDEVRYLAEDRRRQAQRNADAAARFDALAAVMVRARARQVGDLPPADLAELLSPAVPA